MPRAALALALALRFVLIVVSGIASSRPPPNVGVGTRKITLLLARLVAKSGWLMLQPAGLSDRPTMVNRSWTPPSGCPLDRFLTNRASRTGPLAAIKLA